MKRIAFLVLGLIIFTTQFAFAQVSLDTIFIKTKKKTTVVFEQVRYYYFPNLQAYFDTTQKQYLYYQDSTWVTSETLPPITRGYSFRNGLYVMIKDYFGETPYSLYDLHKKLYPPDYSTKRKPINQNITK